MKNYVNWLIEGESHFAEPVSAEMLMGNVNTPMGPHNERWINEVPRMSEYIKLAKKAHLAINNKDDDVVKDVIKSAKTLGLFRNEQDTLWRRAQVDSPETFGKDAEYRQLVARYILDKTDRFIRWSTEKDQ
jgi:hypothetical protein